MEYAILIARVIALLAVIVGGAWVLQQQAEIADERKRGLSGRAR
jgi:uncharacterized protein YdgA (DUF945 family)